MVMEKYSRYTDSKNRLFVLIERLAKIEVQGKNIIYIPTTVTLLNVHEEKTLTLSVDEFNAFVDSKRLVKIEKKQ